jgi:hypothetical protein
MPPPPLPPTPIPPSPVPPTPGPLPLPPIPPSPVPPLPPAPSPIPPGPTPPPPPIPGPVSIPRAGTGIYTGGAYTPDEQTESLAGPIPRQLPPMLPPPVSPVPASAIPSSPYPAGPMSPRPPMSSIPASPVPAGLTRAAARGTVYGGQMGRPAESPLEQSGSLTGAILARGQSTQFRPARKRSRLRSTLVITGAIIGFVAIIGAVVYVLAGDFLRALFHAIAHV